MLLIEGLFYCTCFTFLSVFTQLKKLIEPGIQSIQVTESFHYALSKENAQDNKMNLQLRILLHDLI